MQGENFAGRLGATLSQGKLGDINGDGVDDLGMGAAVSDTFYILSGEKNIGIVEEIQTWGEYLIYSTGAFVVACLIAHAGKMHFDYGVADILIPEMI